LKARAAADLAAAVDLADTDLAEAAFEVSSVFE
jgi:hypothetical protein